MGGDYYAVYCREVKIADNMTLEVALLFVKAYFQEYYNDNFDLTIRKVAHERNF